MRAIAKSALLAALLVMAACATAPAKGLDTMPAKGGVAPSWSPYRYVTMAPQHPKAGGRTTTLARIDREGGGIERWWFLRGSWLTPSLAYDRSGGGLSADGSTLVLAAFRYAYPRPGRWTSRFAIVDTRLDQDFDPATGEIGHPVKRITLPGDYRLAGISPDGSTLYLYRYPRPGYPAVYEIRAYDVARGRLRPAALFDSRKQRLAGGLPIKAMGDGEGRWTYTLYDGNGHSPYLQALDTKEGRVLTVGLSHITDTRASAARRPSNRFLAFAETPRSPREARPANVLARRGVIGRSVQGRPIVLQQMGDPKWSGELLVFGCVHGDECGASGIMPTTGGCPDPSADIYLVPNLNPDGARAGSRLNGRGVDLNRNFPSEWKPIGRRWDPQYAGPKPFSEPETRLTARLIERLRPETTIWFHQYSGTRPFVRAWGQSAPAARRFARLARMPFHLLRWPAGTAPNWQNHTYRGSSAFVVELPVGRVEPRLREQLTKALVRMGRWVRED